jgi:hypothetical protein
VLDTFSANEERSPSEEEALDFIQSALRSACARKAGGAIPAAVADGLNAIVTLSNYRLLNGMILRNIQRIVPTSDLARHWEHHPEEIPNDLFPQCHGNFAEFVRRHAETALEPLCLAGSGLFAIGNSMNHSCEPNAIIVTGGSTFRIAARALGDIYPGEELTFSYIDEDQPVALRQRELKEKYCFDCRCPKCKRELGLR